MRVAQCMHTLTEVHLPQKISKTGKGNFNAFSIRCGIWSATSQACRFLYKAAHGFTTKKDGHGFGLHSAALAATEMGGALSVKSAGPGKGATFILDLPAQPKEVLS